MSRIEKLKKLENDNRRYSTQQVDLEMLSQKSFIKKTKRGNVIKVVKEHYLRDDIYCGLGFCNSCPLHPSNLSNESKQIFIPDTNILYHQVDIFEHQALKQSDFVILQTTLDELRHKSFAVYNRIRAVISDSASRCYVFCNEHHRSTFIQKLPNESPNDRNDRGIFIIADKISYKKFSSMV
jgi:exosome complex exonuclease DIS3/RRP44